MIRMKKFRVSCDFMGSVKKFLFLKIGYKKDYMGQIQIRNPPNEIPRIVKCLNKALKDYNEMIELNKEK
jgi:hypothetical protein